MNLSLLAVDEGRIRRHVHCGAFEAFGGIIGIDEAAADDVGFDGGYAVKDAVRSNCISARRVGRGDF